MPLTQRRQELRVAERTGYSSVGTRGREVVEGCEKGKRARLDIWKGKDIWIVVKVGG